VAEGGPCRAAGRPRDHQDGERSATRHGLEPSLARRSVGAPSCSAKDRPVGSSRRKVGCPVCFSAGCGAGSAARPSPSLDQVLLRVVHAAHGLVVNVTSLFAGLFLSVLVGVGVVGVGRRASASASAGLRNKRNDVIDAPCSFLPRGGAQHPPQQRRPAKSLADYVTQPFLPRAHTLHIQTSARRVLPSRVYHVCEHWEHVAGFGPG